MLGWGHCLRTWPRRLLHVPRAPPLFRGIARRLAERQGLDGSETRRTLLKNNFYCFPARLLDRVLFREDVLVALAGAEVRYRFVPGWAAALDAHLSAYPWTAAEAPALVESAARRASRGVVGKKRRRAERAAAADATARAAATICRACGVACHEGGRTVRYVVWPQCRQGLCGCICESAAGLESLSLEGPDLVCSCGTAGCTLPAFRLFSLLPDDPQARDGAGRRLESLLARVAVASAAGPSLTAAGALSDAVALHSPVPSREVGVRAAAAHLLEVVAARVCPHEGCPGRWVDLDGCCAAQCAQPECGYAPPLALTVVLCALSPRRRCAVAGLLLTTGGVQRRRYFCALCGSGDPAWSSEEAHAHVGTCTYGQSVRSPEAGGADGPFYHAHQLALANARSRYDRLSAAVEETVARDGDAGIAVAARVAARAAELACESQGQLRAPYGPERLSNVAGGSLPPWPGLLRFLDLSASERAAFYPIL